MNTDIAQVLRPGERAGGGGDRAAEGTRFDRLKRAGELKAKGVFTVQEQSLRGELRLSEDEMRARRDYFLCQGQHWDYVKKRVVLSQAGAEILRGTLKAVLPEKTPPADCAPIRRAPVALLMEKNAPPVLFTGTLIVWAMPARNPRLVVCYLPGTDPSNPLNLVSLHVRTNINFLKDMMVPPPRGPGASVQVKRVSDTAYELLGACPRWRGRW